jgi:hypothetical protein
LVVFACLAPNSPGCGGEADKDRTRGFVAFAHEGETVEVPCAPGTAVKFVEPATGRASGLMPLGRIVI